MVKKQIPARFAPAYRQRADGSLELTSVSLVAEGFHPDPHTTMTVIEESTPFTKSDYLKILESMNSIERDRLMYGRFGQSDTTKDASEK